MYIIKIDAIGSSNSFLREMLQTSVVQEEVVVVAKKQTQGRGQKGTSWQSREGKSLTFSVYKKLNGIDTEKQFFIAMAVTTALIEALHKQEIKNLSVKWPNDILAGSRKVAGILIENILRGNKITGSIIGIGLNVNETYFENLPQAGSMKMATGKDYELDRVLEGIISAIETHFLSLKEQNYDEISEKYHTLLFRKDKVSTFEEPSGSRFSGIIKGVDENGKLKISLENGQIDLFDLKEIKMLY